MAMRRKGGLGRGLGALIPQNTPDQAEVEPAPQPLETTPEEESTSGLAVLPVQNNLSGVLEIPAENIVPNPRQPRHEMHPERLDELAQSIAEHGILQPLVITRGEEEGTYSLIAGERRWRAAILAGLTTVPVIIKEASSREMLELALVENLQRADLNSLEEAAAYQALVEEFGLKQEEVAQRVGKSRQAVANALRLLRLPPVIQEALMLGLISEGHARAILQVPDEQAQTRLMEHVVADGLSVRQTEALARRLAESGEPSTKQPHKESDAPDDLYSEVHALEDRFRMALGTKVQLSRSRRGGKLVIYFYSDEELDRIYGTIVGDQE
ncbi:MAG TPA: ParB/RepB/Spo0J family partition protein [Chloroflexia bacterium]|nr:ParB/RepB/Spo0J family partition protein [Chloroflexia bacterium]